MFCKFCGKEIDPDSHFCKYCGHDLESASTSHSKSNNCLLSGFLNLSKKWQIILMVYSIWALGWLLVCVSEHFKDNFLGGFIVFVIVIPLFMLFVWHYMTHLRRKPINNEVNIVKSISLMDFAKDYAKMQMVKDYDPKKSAYKISFVFTDSDGNVINVKSSDAVKGLSSRDISRQKFELCVNVYADGHFELSRNQQSSRHNDSVCQR